MTAARRSAHRCRLENCNRARMRSRKTVSGAICCRNRTSVVEVSGDPSDQAPYSFKNYRAELSVVFQNKVQTSQYRAVVPDRLRGDQNGWSIWRRCARITGRPSGRCNRATSGIGERQLRAADTEVR